MKNLNNEQIKKQVFEELRKKYTQDGWEHYIPSMAEAIQLTIQKYEESMNFCKICGEIRLVDSSIIRICKKCREDSWDFNKKLDEEFEKDAQKHWDRRAKRFNDYLEKRIQRQTAEKIFAEIEKDLEECKYVFTKGHWQKLKHTLKVKIQSKSEQK